MQKIKWKNTLKLNTDYDSNSYFYLSGKEIR